MTVTSLKETSVRSITVEWQMNGQQQFVTLTEWANREGVDLSSHNIAPIQLTNHQLMSFVNCATKLFFSPSNNN
jgi:hypothetical protein